VIFEGSLVPATFLIILFLGSALGLLVGLVGTGSVLAVPLLVYGVGLSVHRAICVAMLTMTLLGFTGSIQKLHVGAIDLRASSLIAICGVLFAPLGAWLNKQLSPEFLLILFAFVVIAIAIGTLLSQTSSANPTNRSRAVTPKSFAAFRSITSGALIGLLGGLLGISGGFVAVPVLVSYYGMEMHRAVATSWAIVAVVSAAATAGHIAAGQRFPLQETLPFLIGGIIGFEIGLHAAPRFSGTTLKRIFAAVILLMSAGMLARLLHA
jgi:uncharacterized membrane protein YfcA